MSKDKISQYSSTSAGANLNTDIAGINIDEGCPPSGINNAIRALMSQVKDLQSGVSGDTIPIAAGGTGEASAASARAALGVAIDSDVMKYVAPGSAGNLLVSTGADWTSSASAAVVSSVTAGAGISVSANTGNVTITNTGVTDITAGAGISLSANTGSITISAAGGGGFSNMDVFTSPGTWTNPGNVTKVKVTVVGGGGGGGTANLSNTGAAGGGGGGAAIEVIPFPTGTNVPVTIGAGGNVASSGGTSSFGPYCSATGGLGGSSTPSNTMTGGGGGAGSGGSINLVGADGGSGAATIPGAYAGGGSQAGSGGPSFLGGGGMGGGIGEQLLGPTSPALPGSAGNNYGGGGGGGRSGDGPSGTGGAGAGGVVVVEY